MPKTKADWQIGLPGGKAKDQVAAPAETLVSEACRELQQRQPGRDVIARDDRPIRTVDQRGGACGPCRIRLKRGKRAEERNDVCAGKTLEQIASTRREFVIVHCDPY